MAITAFSSFIEVRFGGARASVEDYANRFVGVFFSFLLILLYPLKTRGKKHQLLASYFLFVLILCSSTDSSFIESTSDGLIHLNIFSLGRCPFNFNFSIHFYFLVFFFCFFLFCCFSHFDSCASHI